jgi:hypothetical protein
MPRATRQGRTVVRPFFVSAPWFPPRVRDRFEIAMRYSNGTIAAVPVLNPDNSKAGTEKETKT